MNAYNQGLEVKFLLKNTCNSMKNEMQDIELEYRFLMEEMSTGRAELPRCDFPPISLVDNIITF